MYEGYLIRTGFLAGNLFADESGVDVDASARKYAEAVKTRLEAEYPGAEVEVPFQLNAGGCLPAPLQTMVIGPDPDEDPGRMKEAVELVAAEVWEAQEWLVLLPEEDR